MKNNSYIQKKWMHFKVSTLSASMTALVLAGIPNASTASDIDIYQAGGTGKIDILFMLDVSNSMYTYQFTNDYAYTSEYKPCHLAYEKNTSGQKSVTFKNVGNGMGSYSRSGNSSSNYVYTFQGPNNGQYEIDSVVSYVNQNSSTRYNVINCNSGSNAYKPYKFCTASIDLISDKIIYNRIYSKEGDPSCEIDLSGIINSTYLNDIAYINRIEKVCEKDVNNENRYLCLTRFANLKKALISLVNSDSIKENMYFTLGYYPYGTGNNVNGYINSTKNIQMNTAGKNTFLDQVAKLSTENGTPIAKAYEVARGHFSAVDTTGTSESCIGRGLYFLTDGYPQLEGSGNPTEDSTTISPMSSKYWSTIGRKSRILRTDKAVKTATVGFGKDYFANGAISDKGKFSCDLLTAGSQQAQLCHLGNKGSTFGEGGFYNAQSTADLIDSITTFVSDVTKPVEGSTMGVSTIPVDALNSTQLQAFSYFPMFKPLIGTNDQLWAGNLKKFKVNTTSGTIVDQNNNTVFEGDNIRDSLEDYWYESNGSSTDDRKMAWGGILSKLKVHTKPTLLSNGNVALNRELYINQSGQLKKVTEVLNSNNKPTNAQYLYGLLGYSKLTATDFTALESKSYVDQLAYLKDKQTLQNYQMGSIIHSTPIMLTQEGSFGYVGNEYVSKGRKDYILTGTTQGLVQVVDAVSGKEVFSFLPAEFLSGTTNQAKGFAESLAMDRKANPSQDKFFYGVDGSWVSYTEYKNKFNTNTDTVTNTTTEVESLVASKQYVYGGLRMGGNSYYGLDLTQLGSSVSTEKPTMLFHIDPANAAENSPLFHMGQSWSKPTVTYIRWNGQKKLAMIVGGGYDPKYENSGFKYSSTDTVKGNGIYVFDAENGDLLWWGSSDATTAKQSTLTGNKTAAVDSTNISTMTNSIPSRIKAVDRDGDGITDHLYTGDLGGQVFRVDFNSKHKISSTRSEQQSLVSNAFKLADLNTSGKNPLRFYEPPTFTIHKDGGKRFAILALSSGDRSSPLVSDENAAPDIVVAIEDHGVITSPVTTSTIAINDLHDLNSNRADGDKGWYFPAIIDSKNLRGFEPGIALDNDLYFSLFNPDKSTADTTDVTSCTGGITGESTAYKFCLPYGTCSATVKGPVKVGSLGPGILGLTLGPGRSSETNRTLIFNKETSPVPPEYTVTDKLVPRRWFEYLPYKSGS